MGFSQNVEYDDMYFNKKDREKLRENMMVSNKSTKVDRVTTSTSKSEQISRFNPTDSYSARNVNPDYVDNQTSKRNPEFADDEYLPEEYSDGYRSAQMANANAANNWYTPGFYGPRHSAWNSPYFGMGGMYNPWMTPMWGAPSSMWSMNMGFGWGNSWNRNSMMWGNPWMMDPFMMNPYNAWAWDPWYNPRWGMGGMYGMNNNFWGRPGFGGMWGNNWCPTTIVVVGDSHNSHIARTRRPSRGGSFNSAEYYNANLRSRDRNSTNTVVNNNMSRQGNRYDNSTGNTVNRFDGRQNSNTRSNINTYQSRTSSTNSAVAPSRQRVQSYSPSSQPSQSRSYSPSFGSGTRSSGSSNVGTIGGASRSSGGSVGTVGGASRSSGGSSSGSSSGGSRSRGGN